MGMLGSGTVHLEEHAWDPRLLVASADQSLAKKSPAANPPSSPPPSLPTPSRCFLASRRGCGGPQGANIIAPSHPCLSLCLIVSRTFYHYVRACVRRQHGGRTACRTRRREPRMDFVQRPHAVMFIDTNVLDTSMTVSLSRSSPLKSMWASSSSDSQSPSPSTAKAACYGHGPYGTTGEAPVQERPARMPPN